MITTRTGPSGSRPVRVCGVSAILFMEAPSFKLSAAPGALKRSSMSRCVFHRADIADFKRSARQSVEQLSKSIFPMASVADTMRPESTTRSPAETENSPLATATPPSSGIEMFAKVALSQDALRSRPFSTVNEIPRSSPFPLKTAPGTVQVERGGGNVGVSRDNSG